MISNLIPVGRRPGRYPAWVCALGLLLAVAPAPVFAKPTVDPRFDYAEMFELTRGVMTRKPARTLLTELFANELRVNAELAAKYGFTAEKVTGFTETQMMLLLQEATHIRDQIRAYLKEVPANADTLAQTPEVAALRKKWKETFITYFQDRTLLEKFLKKNNPLEPFVMAMPPGKKGFGEVLNYISHDIVVNGVVTHRADDLERTVADFIGSAKSEIRFNVFDFDSDLIADALIKAHQAGRKVMGGIDKGVIDVRPEVKAVYDRLVAAGIPIQAVDSVGLNHQKLITIDWSLVGEGRVLMSTGNFTKSCLNPAGDMAGTHFHSEFSRPNSNIINVFKSDEAAILVHHELTKTVDPQFALRGREYPLSGAYEILGETIDGESRKFIIAFTPNGGLGDIEQNFISRMIKTIPGPTYLAQFAFSSKEVEAAMLEDAIASVKAGKPYVLRAVGDTPFAMQKWSIFLSISGYRLEGDGKAKGYVKIPDAENKWLQALGPTEYRKLQESVKIAPRLYGTHSVKTPEGPFQVTSKLHLKVVVKGETGNQVGIFGSFNVSEGAESNQEYIVALRDKKTNKFMKTAVLTLSDESPRSIVAEAERRNVTRQFDPDQGKEPDAGKAGRSADNVKVDCNKLLQSATVGILRK